MGPARPGLAGLGSRTAPVGTVPTGGGSPINALSGDVVYPPTRQLRGDVLAELAALPEGQAPDLVSLRDRIRWRRPMRRAEIVEAVTAAVLREAEWLGITGRGALSTAGRLLFDATAGPSAAEEAIDTHLPSPVEHVLLQADLTAVAPGRLEGSLAQFMRLVADVESRGGATVYRFSPKSVRRGLDAGWSSAQVLNALQDASRTPVPQPLEYLVGDVFKRVNDSLGHLVGDTLLRAVAERFTASLRATDVVSRFGGDEFMVLLPGLPGSDAHAGDAEEVAQKLLTTIGAPLDAEGRPLSVTPSIGIALYPGDAATPEELVRQADAAMYLAKARGRANYQFFDAGTAGLAYAELVLEGQLAQALERGEFELYFQPQVCARDGRLAGAEALLRWHHPQRGLLGADAFIGVAEQRQLMLPIGQWVIAQAARCAGRWRQLGLKVATVAANLSSVQFQSAGFLDGIEQLLPTEGLQPGMLELELTERMLMDDLPKVRERLGRLQTLGVKVSVDDFGTGYSSLGHLKELPIDKLKIDRSFVHDLPANRNSAAITRAIIQMGRSLGLTVVAEGVETEAQRAFLADNGCDELQGLLIGAPLSQADFEAWVAARQGG